MTFDGATTRAASTNSDGALLELFNQIPQDEDVVFSGWDRSGTTPPESTIIHHPRADVMKITFDASSPFELVNDRFFVERLEPVTIGDGFRHTFQNTSQDFGVLESGSQGPLIMTTTKESMLFILVENLQIVITLSIKLVVNSVVSGQEMAHQQLD